MDLNVATFDQLKNFPSIGEHRAQAILDVRAHLDRYLTLLDLTPEAEIPGYVMRSIIDGKLIVSVPRHDGELVDRVNANNEEDLYGLAADFARQMKEVTLAALDRITKEMERLPESVQTVYIYIQVFLRCSMSWDGRLFLNEDMRRDSFFATKVSTVWQKCPLNASLLRCIRTQELNRSRCYDRMIIQLAVW